MIGNAAAPRGVLISNLFAMVRRNRELELKHGRICALTSMRCLEVDGCDTVEMHNIIEIL